MESNLKLQYAYFSAIQFVNEKQARQFASEQVRSNADDAEAQDTWGYVLLRFASNAQDVEKVLGQFRQAIKNPKAERITKRLASAHLQQAQETLARFKGH
ncbi:MAG: hypothetical protein DMD96_06150 [Candidatus Rokuibacteriota bacterium]|nr:MAG: hypothetical protein DMD96_06150 [Candidatus Rokubacteria bacterium]TMH68941.1 MAG: hypothetical protein E6H51_16810 [Betaproteobacteria bacterium]